MLYQKIQALKNIRSCLQSAGSGLEKIVSRKIYMIDMAQFRAVDRIWAEWVGEPFPGSTCVQVSAGFPLDGFGSGCRRMEEGEGGDGIADKTWK